MTSIESPQARVEGTNPEGLLAPWWHTALMVLLIIGLSLAGVRQLRSLGDKPLHLVANYSLSIVYEWVLAGLALWGIHLRQVPLRQLLGERRPGPRRWLADCAAAFVFWLAAIAALGVVGSLLTRVSGSHIDPRKIGDVTQKLTPSTGIEMLLFVVLSISAGICEEIVFRGYLQQQFGRMSRRIWVGVALSAVVFGCAHGYEGIAGVLLITAYGAMFGSFARLRRGLRAGMIAHAWHDTVSGVALVLLRHYGVHLSGK